MADVARRSLPGGGRPAHLVAAIGILRFPDVLTRMHSATKPQVLGLLLVLLGLGLRLRDPAAIGLLALVALFQLVTSPIASHMVGRASFRAGQVRRDLLVVDELTNLLAQEKQAEGPVMYDEVGAWSGKQYPRGAVVVGYNGKEHSRAALAWAAEEAVRQGAPLVVLYAANYTGMTLEPGDGLHHRDPGALEAAEEVTARGVAEALEAHPGVVGGWGHRGGQPVTGADPGKRRRRVDRAGQPRLRPRRWAPCSARSRSTSRPAPPAR